MMPWHHSTTTHSDLLLDGGRLGGTVRVIQDCRTQGSPK